jgi:DNA-binding MarR family transcriptional regulator
LIDPEGADANSRLTTVRLALLTARMMELWRRGTRDSDTVMILVSVMAIAAERLTRTELPDDQKTLAQPLAREMMASCNVSSIAAATGLNRETARRRVNRLIQQGLLVRTAEGDIRFPPGALQRPATRDLIRQQLEAVTRFLNESLKDGVLKIV